MPGQIGDGCHDSIHILATIAQVPGPLLAAQALGRIAVGTMTAQGLFQFGSGALTTAGKRSDQYAHRLPIPMITCTEPVVWHLGAGFPCVSLMFITQLFPVSIMNCVALMIL